jgi:hypothetical protein
MHHDFPSIVPIATWVAAIGATVAAVILRGTFSLRAIADELLRYIFIFPLGVQGLWGFAGHVFFPEEAAYSIGWAPSPFQYEVGVTNLGIGVASLYAAFAGFQARAAVALVAGCFLGGAGFGHMLNLLAGDTPTPGNSGPLLVSDFLTPIVALVLLIVFPPTSRANETAGAGATGPLQSRLSKLGPNSTGPGASDRPASPGRSHGSH